MKNNCRYKQLSREQIIYVLNHAKMCYLGVAENDQPYVVPMYYCCQTLDCHNVIFKLISCGYGLKMKCMHANNKVCLCINMNVDGCVHSVVVFGKANMETCECACDGMSFEIVADRISGRSYETMKPVLGDNIF